jgi:hypothetical protein
VTALAKPQSTATFFGGAFIRHIGVTPAEYRKRYTSD